MNDLDKAFDHPERMSDEQMRMMIEMRERARNQRVGLTAFSVVVISIAAVIIVSILAANGVFGG